MKGYQADDGRVVTDFVAGLVLFALGAAMAVWSALLPHPAGWPSAPGLTPLFAFGLMGLLGARLAGRAVAAGVLRRLAPAVRAIGGAGAAPSSRKLAFLIAAMFVYYLILPRFLPFELSTFAFLFVMFMALHGRSVLANAAIAAVVTLALSGLFGHAFGTLLPGLEWRNFAPGLHAYADGAMSWLSTGW